MPTPSALKVLHIASHAINVGDGALNWVIQQRLHRLSPTPVEFTLVDSALNPPTLTAKDTDKFDLVIVGGGGAINNSSRTAQNGIELAMTLDEYRQARVPFAFVALGHNAFYRERLRNTARLSQLIATAAERGDPFSVRNDGSLARLRRDIGSGARTVVEIPDPGFFVGSPATPPLESGERPYLLLQVAADRLAMRQDLGPAQRALHHVWPRNFGSLANVLSNFAFEMWRTHGLDILVAPHIPIDASLAAVVVEQLYRRSGSSTASRPFRLLGTPHPSHAVQFFSAYAAATLVVGMRGHAAICAVGLRRPFVALDTHPKIAGFMESCGLGEWSVPAKAHFAQHLLSKASSLLLRDVDVFYKLRDQHTTGFELRLDDFLAKALARVDVISAHQ